MTTGADKALFGWDEDSRKTASEFGGGGDQPKREKTASEQLRDMYSTNPAIGDEER